LLDMRRLRRPADQPPSSLQPTPRPGPRQAAMSGSASARVPSSSLPRGWSPAVRGRTGAGRRQAAGRAVT